MNQSRQNLGMKMESPVAGGSPLLPPGMQPPMGGQVRNALVVGLQDLIWFKADFSESF